MSEEPPYTRDPDDDAAPEGAPEAEVHAALASELGDSIAEALTRMRESQERHHTQTHPDEGLRERKKRQTRQRISDVATALFVFRGFDAVRVSDVADVVGVSEKTIYNYFATKEAMVFDREDDEVERISEALRERDDAESLTRFVLRTTITELDRLAASPGAEEFFAAFADMVAATPSLRAALLDIQSRLIAVTAEALAAAADLGPQEPEPMIAARAIIGLRDISFDMLARHVRAGLRGKELRDAVVEDLERAARLLETGLWSFKLLTTGARTRQQVLDAARTAEDARSEVIRALKDARSAWRKLHREEGQDIRQSAREVSRSAREVSRSAREAGRTARDASRTASRAARDAWGSAPRGRRGSDQGTDPGPDQAAYEFLRDALRHRPGRNEPE
jgi:AcrR family transcriptional regulator